jgi:DNA (cytosine-5)-methyltransferase 1
MTLPWPTAIDLFSGIGGLTLGLRLARVRVTAALELDDFAADTYSDNFPSVALLRKDIRDLSATELLNAAGLRNGHLDLLAGCPPCQGFSTIRTRNTFPSIKDRRNDLLFDFLRLAEDTEPRVILMENVPRLSEDARYLKMTRRLRETGYAVRTQVLDAADHGVPQRRRRLIMVASRIGEIGDSQAAPSCITVRTALSSLPSPGQSGDPAHDHGERRSDKVQRIIEAVPADGGSRTSLSQDLQLTCHRDSDGFFDVYGRMSWDEPAPTITGGCINPSKGRYLHPEHDRAITVREAAMLQGFPIGFRLGMDRGKYAAAEHVGNALPPEFVRRQAAPIRKAIQRDRKMSSAK